MKGSMLSIIFVVAIITRVLGTSAPNCAGFVCSPEACQSPGDCQCGTYKDYCGCCDLCYKCPSEECVPLFQHRCQNGHKCELNDPSERIESGARGVCKPTTE